MGPLILPAINAGLALAGTVAGAIPNKYDKFAKKRVGELNDDLAAGRGLSGAEAQAMMNSGMQGVRAQTGSMGSELARLQAAGGGLGGGAQAAAARDSMAGVIGSAAEKVGSRVGAANIDAMGQKRQELESRMAVQGQKRTDNINNITKVLGDTVASYGDIMGAPPGTYAQGGDVEAQAQARREARRRAAMGVV
jgi:hypothetical protein